MTELGGGGSGPCRSKQAAWCVGGDLSEVGHGLETMSHLEITITSVEEALEHSIGFRTSLARAMHTRGSLGPVWLVAR